MNKGYLCGVVLLVLLLTATTGYCLEDWKNLGLYGGSVAQVAIDAHITAAEDHYTYCRTSSPVWLFKSRPAGGSGWVKLDFPNSAGPTAINTTQNNGYLYAASAASLYYSTDGGTTWTEVSDVVNGSAIDVSAGNTVYVGANDSTITTQKNIFVSSDDGATWTAKLSSPLTANGFTDINVSGDDAYVWASVQGSGTVYRWLTTGSSWIQSNFDLTLGLPGFRATYITVDAINSAIVFIAGIDNTGASYLLRTTDGTAVAPTFDNITPVNPGTGKVWIRDDSTKLYHDNNYSTDNGTNWTALPNPSTINNLNAVLYMCPVENNVLYATTDQGIALSDDAGTSFTANDTGLTAVQVEGGVQNPSDSTNLVIVSKSGVGRSTDTGINWSFVTHGNPWTSLAVDSNGAYFYAGDTQGDVEYSPDGGAIWTSTGLGPDVASALGTSTSHKICLDPVSDTIIYTAIATSDWSNGAVYKLTRSGNSFTNQQIAGTTGVPAICVHSYDNAGASVILFAYGDKTANTVTAATKRSPDGGGTWATVADLAGYVVQCITADPNTNTTLYAGTGYNTTHTWTDNSGTIFKSTDGGVNWNNLNPNSGNVGAFSSIVVDPADSSKIYAACKNIIYASLDSGATWFRYYVGESAETFLSLFMYQSASSTAANLAQTTPLATTYSLALGSQQGLYLWGTSTEWYLAEGCTSGEFDTWLLIANPQAATATATVTYYTADDSSSQQYTIDPTSRYSIHVDAVSGLESTDVSMKITSDQSVTCERALYWNNMARGHDTIGVTAPSTTWYFAEGCTNNFDQYILLMNPNSTTANVALTFMDPDGNTQISTTTVDVNRRKTIHVNNETDYSDLSTKVESDVPIVAERSMYWNSMASGHCTVGTTSPSNSWYFPEGYTGGYYDTWVLIQNPNPASATCTVNYYLNGQDAQQETVTVGANSRYSIHLDAVNDIMADAEVSTYIDAGTSQVIAERSMYWNGEDGDGSCSIGAKALATTWYLAEGCTNGFNEYILLMNPNSSSATVSVSYLKDDGTTVSGSYTVEPTSRYTIHVNNIEGLTSASLSASITSTQPIAVERAMYFGDFGGNVSIGQRK